MIKKDFLPVILGSDENAYGMARAFHEKYNIIPSVLCKQVLVPSRYSKIMDITRTDDLDLEHIFIQTIGELAEDKLKEYQKLILIPCSYRYTELAAKNSAFLEKYFCNRFISYELLSRFITKDKFYGICGEYNLPYPQTVVCEKKDRLDIPGKLPFDFPVALKADNSNSYDYLNSKFEGKKKFFYVETKEEYYNIIEKMNASGYNGNMIIQDYIPGHDSDMRVLNCFSDNNGQVRLMSLGQPVIEEYTPLNLGNFAALISDYNIEIFGLVKRFLEDIKYTGFSNFDMKFDAASGKYKFIDFNPRQGRSSFFVTASGFNLAEFLADCCVYEKSADTIYAKSDMLWLTVPKKIIYKYTSDREVLNRAKKLIKEKKYAYTLLYKKDMNLKRFLRIKLYYNRHISDYKKYYFKKKQ